MEQLALFPRPEQLRLAIIFPTTKEHTMPPQPPPRPMGLIERIRRAIFGPPRRPAWTPPSTTTELVDADWTIIRTALQAFARDSAAAQTWAAYEAAIKVLDKVGRR